MCIVLYFLLNNALRLSLLGIGLRKIYAFEE